MTGTAKPVSSTEKERQEVLHRIWLAQAKALAETLENTPPQELQAATLNVARQFLSDNRITSDSLKDQSGEGPLHWMPSQADIERQSDFASNDEAYTLPPADPE
jgi:hypothetical protein